MPKFSSHPSTELTIANQKSKEKKSRRGKGNEQGAKFWHPTKVAFAFVIFLAPFDFRYTHFLHFTIFFPSCIMGIEGIFCIFAYLSTI